MAREKTFNLRLSAEEWARLEKLATHHALPAASVLRMLMKKADDQLKREERR